MPPIRAKDPAGEAWNRQLIDDFMRKGFYHSIPLPDGSVLEGILPLEVLNRRVSEFPIPQRLDGKRVLDIGTWDGFFAFEMERRGAEVMAIDNTEVENFYVARQLTQSNVEYRVQDVYELSPERNGTFDIVLFMGVLYHLKHPLLGLERVCEVTRNLAIVESFVTNESATGETCTLQFYETTELLGQIDNWCGPNVECLLAFCRTAGFARAELVRVREQRAVVACYRHWLPEPERPQAQPPLLLDCTHAGNYGFNVSRKKDDFLTAFFKSEETDLNIDNVFPEVGSYGIKPVAVLHTGGDGWQANFLVPPGLTSGWHEARVRTARSRFSGVVPIALEMPAIADRLHLQKACDSSTWAEDQVKQSGSAFLTLWVEGLPANADRGNLHVLLGGKRLQVDTVSPDKQAAPVRQVNAKLPAAFPTGSFDLMVKLGGVQSNVHQISVTS